MPSSLLNVLPVGGGLSERGVCLCCRGVGAFLGCLSVALAVGGALPILPFPGWMERGRTCVGGRIMVHWQGLLLHHTVKL